MRGTVLAVLVLSSVASCGKGSSESSADPVPVIPTTPVAFKVLSTTPVSGAAGVSRPVTVGVSFSKMLAAATVTSTSFFMTSSQGSVPSTLQVAGTFAYLTPTVPLGPTTVYSVKVTKDVADQQGAKLGADHAWSFTTMGLRWSMPEPLENEAMGVSVADAAMNPSGQAVVAWIQGGSVFARVLLDAEDGWTDAEELDAGDGATDARVAAAIDAAGHALVVWVDQVYLGRLRSRRYVPSDGWQPAETVDDQAISSVYPPRLLMFPNQQGYVCYASYSQAVGLSYVLAGRGRLFVPGSGWQAYASAPVQYADDDNIDYAVSAGGEILAVHSTASPTQNGGERLLVRRFDGSWSSDPFPTTFANRPNRPRMALDGDGNAVAVWRDEETNEMTAAHYSLDSGWSTLTDLPPGGALTDPHVIGCDASGNAVLAWPETSGAQPVLKYRMYFASINAWTDANVGPQHSGGVAQLQFKMRSSGDGFLAWTEFDGSRWSLRESRYGSASGWSPSTTIDADAAFDMIDPRLVIGEDGTATLVWIRIASGTRNLMISRFD